MLITNNKVRNHGYNDQNIWNLNSFYEKYTMLGSRYRNTYNEYYSLSEQTLCSDNEYVPIRSRSDSESQRGGLDNGTSSDNETVVYCWNLLFFLLHGYNISRL